MRVLSIDPGITYMGIAVLDIPDTPGPVTLIKRECIQGNKLLKHYRDIRGTYPDKFIIMIAFQDLFKDLITQYEIEEVVSEGAFAHIRIAAFESLVRIIMVLQFALSLTIHKTLNVVSPQFVKKAWTGSGGKDVNKDDMRIVYLTKDYVLGDEDPESAAEHEIDAVAHGYAYACRDIWKTVLPEPKKPKKKKKT